MNNNNNNDRIVLTEYREADTTRAATPARAERQRAAQVAYWSAQADVAAERSVAARQAGLSTLAKIEQEITEICAHMAIKMAKG